MTPEAIRLAVIDAAHVVAPEADFARVRADAPLREELDIDSFDFLRVLIELHVRLGVDVPESDYAQVGTLDDMVAYLGRRLGSPPAPAAQRG